MLKRLKEWSVGFWAFGTRTIHITCRGLLVHGVILFKGCGTTRLRSRLIVIPSQRLIITINTLFTKLIMASKQTQQTQQQQQQQQAANKKSTAEAEAEKIREYIAK
jgi:hypothetical protein